MNANLIILLFILITIVVALIKKENVYSLYLDGCFEGLKVCKGLFLNLMGMMIAISLLRESGLLELMNHYLSYILSYLNIPTSILPLLLIKPLSGSAGLALVVDFYNTYGVDHYLSYLATLIQSSSDTTFYLFALYFGSISIKKHKYALKLGLIASIISYILCLIMILCIF